MKMQETFNPFQAILNGKELKGRTRITLTDVHTGKEEVSVKEVFMIRFRFLITFSKKISRAVTGF